MGEGSGLRIRKACVLTKRPYPHDPDGWTAQAVRPSSYRLPALSCLCSILSNKTIMIMPMFEDEGGA